MKQEYSIFILSLQFLTRIPVRSDSHYNELRMAEIPRYFPLVGALIGAAAGAVFLLAHELLSPDSALLISVAATMALTGAFHEDGLADTFDGIGGGAARGVRPPDAVDAPRRRPAALHPGAGPRGPRVAALLDG